MRTFYCRIYEQDEGYTVLFPDLPGCITEGNTLEEAINMAEEALAFHIRCLVKSGENAPEPSRAKDVAKSGFDEDGDPFTIAGIVHRPKIVSKKRINISINEAQLDEIDKAAEEAGMTRSGFLVLCAQTKIQNDSDAN